MSDAEPRRSVRSTKGQHKSLDQLEHAAALDGKKRGRKGSKKPDSPQRQQTQEPEEDDTEEEIIRCVCGAREQDGDPGEPWIACDTCAAWQHNVCMGMSVYSEDLPKDYYCEQCKPENHKELLEGMARGEKPWEERRRQYEEEKASGKRRKGGRKAKGKRNSDATKEGSAKPSPTPEARRSDAKGPAGTKRKTRADSEDDKDGRPSRRKLSEEVLPVYNPPADLPEHISDLVDTRQAPAKGLSRAITDVLGGMQKRGEFTPADGATVESTAEKFAIQIEWAVHDAHPSHKEYGAQLRTLRFNLKENHELCARLVHGSLIPPMLATMSSDELASRELQQKTARMKAQAERQSILDTEDASAPRLRRTHKGEEIVERDSAAMASEDKPSSLRRQSARDASDATEAGSARRGLEAGSGVRQGRGSLRVETKNEAASANKKDFDLKRVFSSVRSPTSTTGHQRRPSQPQFLADGPGEDPEVDRLLQDADDESPPYSPSAETDPDIVWRGLVSMNTVANFQATARHVGGVNLSATIGLPWTTLVPKKLTVAGRIDEQIATEYLCSLRYSAPTDISVASLSPATDAAKADFLAIIDYFTQRRRYGVVGEKGVGNVRDTYLVPIPSGTSSHPEFMLNLEDNFIPTSRTAPMLLLVVVYRNDAAAMEKLRGPDWAGQLAGNSNGGVGGGLSSGTAPVPASLESTPSTATPKPATNNGAGNGAGSRTASVSAPAFSPMVPQTPTMPTQAQSQVPLPPAPQPQLPQQQQQQQQQQQVQPPVLPQVQPQPPQPLQPQPPAQQQQAPIRPPVLQQAPPAAPPAAAQQQQQQHLPPTPASGPPQHQQSPHLQQRPAPIAGYPTQQQHAPAPHPQQHHTPAVAPAPLPTPHPTPAMTAAAQLAAAREQAQRDGEASAREILGPLATCSAAGFLMTQAAKMQKNEWLLVRAVFEQQPQTQDDLQLLKLELERYNERNGHHHHQQQQQQNQQAHHNHSHSVNSSGANTPAGAAAVKHSQTPVPIPRVPHTAAAAPSPATRPVQSAAPGPTPRQAPS
ncbi:Transcription factor bye1 [Sporothrix eucalyptigena]|uniref:Transcription factor BYE1 n=1 Tax=Sporothrix eucalyptigena TaxID=1812306 RepID=A0ABP0AZG3_9PEZI